MNLTLHYTHGAGYYEDYKGGAKVKDYKLPPYIDSQGDTIAKTDLVRRKWLENDFYGAIYSANYRGERLQFSAGAAINRYDGDHFGRVMWAKQSNNLPEPDYEYYRNTGDKLDYNMYAKANYQLHPNLNGYLDMQYRGIHYTIEGSDDKAGDHVNVDKHWNFFNPKAGINFQKGGHNAFVSFSVANREPNRDNFTEAGRDERPQHETLYDYEAGYGFGNSRFHVGANLYFMDYNNQLILTGKISEIGEALTSNIKDSYRMGIELTGGVKIARWLDWSGNLTLSRNKIKNFIESIEVYDADWNFLREDHNDLGTTDIAFFARHHRQQHVQFQLETIQRKFQLPVCRPPVYRQHLLQRPFHRSLFRQQPACRLRFQTEVYEGDRPRCHDQQFVQRAIRNQCMGILGNGRRRTLQRRRLFHPGGNKRNGTGNIQILNYGTITGIFRSTDRPALSLSGDKAASCHVGCRLPDFPCLCFCLFFSKIYADMGLNIYYVAISIYGFWQWTRSKGRQEQTAEDIETAPQEVILYRNMTLRLLPGSAFPSSPCLRYSIMSCIISPIRRYRQAMLLPPPSESLPPGCWHAGSSSTGSSGSSSTAYPSIFYYLRGLYPTMFLYICYAILAAAGLYTWKKKGIRTNDSTL